MLHPPFTKTSLPIVGVLALAAAAFLTVFTIVRTVLLQPLPYSDPEELVWVWATRTDRDRAFFSIPDARDYQQAVTNLRDMAWFTSWSANLTGVSDPIRLQGTRVTPNVFAMLGVGAVVGRTLTAEDAQGDGRVAMISHRLWTTHFNADPASVGRAIQLNGEALTVVGVWPAHFIFPSLDLDVARPLLLDRDPRRAERDNNFLRLIGRLAPTATSASAAAQFAEISRQLRQQYPRENGKKTEPRIFTLEEEMLGPFRTTLRLLLAAVLLLLGAACINVAGLMLVRAWNRRGEHALRVALGASRSRLVRLIVGEAAGLAGSGVAIGLALATVMLMIVKRFAPPALLRLPDASIDGWTAAAAVAVSVGMIVCTAVMPSVRLWRTDLESILRAQGRPGGLARAGRLTDALVTFEIAIALVLVVTAASLMSTVRAMQGIGPGFDTSRVVEVRVALPQQRYKDVAAVEAFYRSVRERVERLPGVERVTITNVVPLTAMNTRSDFTVVERPPGDPTLRPGAQSRLVGAAYFQTMGIPLRDGRDFSERDSREGARVAIVDDVLVRDVWGGANPIGDHVQIEDASGSGVYEVVGVAAGVKHFTIDEAPLGTLYLPFTQMMPSNLQFFNGSVNIVARTQVNPETLLDDVRREVRAVDPDVPASQARSGNAIVMSVLAPRHFAVALIAAFALMALVLAVMGLYALAAYRIAERRPDLAVRAAMGASPSRLLADIVRESAHLVGAAIILAAVGLVAAQPLLRGLVVGAEGVDSLAFAASISLIAPLTLIATLVAARGVLRMDPVEALRR